MNNLRMDFPVSYLKEILHYDEHTGIFTCKVRTGPRNFPGEQLGKLNNFGHVVIGVCCRSYPAHRLAYYYMTGDEPDPNLVIDHLDHNPQNNAWCNLRLVSVGINNANRGNVRRDCTRTYAYPGVLCDEQGRWWVHHYPEKSFGRNKIVRMCPNEQVAVELKKHLQMGGKVPDRGTKKDKTFSNIYAVLNQ